MRILGLMAIGLTGFAFSGCSQISSAFKKKPHYHTASGETIYTDTDASLRSTPDQGYQFAEQYAGDTEYVYANGHSDISPYAFYDVELYASQPSYVAPAYSDPRDAEFVKLNGESEIADWQNCETLNRGYLLASEYDFSLNPGFEVCMRNKGYVLGTEYGQSSKPALNAQSARLRSATPYSSHGSTYSGYFR